MYADPLNDILEAIPREQSDQWKQNKRSNREQSKPKHPRREILSLLNDLIFEGFELKKEMRLLSAVVVRHVSD